MDEAPYIINKLEDYLNIGRIMIKKNYIAEDF